jgi:hypothetical protein
MLKLNQKCRDETKFPFCFEPFQDSRQTEVGIKFNFSKCAKTLPLKVYFLQKNFCKCHFGVKN